ncbi:9635_t:CDS:1, partial [Gigaspora rosea]
RDKTERPSIIITIHTSIGTFLYSIKMSLRGIKINNDCFKIVAYADDIIVGLGSY